MTMAIIRKQSIMNQVKEENSKTKSISSRGTANISEILYAKLYFHLKKPKTCTLRIWLLKFNLYKVLKTNVYGAYLKFL
jgi:hypothetical protein